MKRLLATATAITALLASPALAEPAMWEVSDADSKVWLFGSVHALPADFDWRTPLFDEKLAQSRLVYFEADVGPLGQIALAGKIAAINAEGTEPWLNRLTFDQRDELAAALAGTGIGMQQAAGMPPWLIVLLLESKAIGDAGYVVDAGVDLPLQYELPKEKKGYFETAIEQIDLMASATLDEEVETLIAELSVIADGKDTMTELVTQWSAGDVEALASIVETDATLASGTFGDTLLYGRNRHWIPVIEGLLSSNEQDLIIVGAAHLAGDGSVIDLLEKAGYTVTRIQ